MKKTLKFATVIAFAFVTVISKANDLKPNLLTTENGKNLIFKLDAPSEDTELTLIDDKGVIIYSENISGQIGYLKKFNLNKLKAGTYTMKVEDLLKVIEYTINLNDGITKISKRKENTKPVFRKKEKMIFLNFLNLEKKDVEIKIYDSTSRVVFSEISKNDMLVEKAFNFSTAYKDIYTVMVKEGNDIYYEDMVVE